MTAVSNLLRCPLCESMPSIDISLTAFRRQHYIASMPAGHDIPVIFMGKYRRARLVTVPLPLIGNFAGRCIFALNLDCRRTNTYRELPRSGVR